VVLESTLVLPARVHVELTGIADRLECLMAEAADFSASGDLDLRDRLLQLLLAARPSVETGE